MWANGIGWMITFSSVICIPIVAIYKICRQQGPFFGRISKLCKPSYEWGPACPTHRALAGFGVGKNFDKNIGRIRGLRNDPSNATLITNVSSSTNLLSSSGSNYGIYADLRGADIRDPNTLAQLAPLNEVYEEEELSGSDQGLNMREVRSEENGAITVMVRAPSKQSHNQSNTSKR
jgi:hypothetical protein